MSQHKGGVPQKRRTGKGSEQVTILDVARAAGVSTATVSRVVNDTDYPVSARSRERVIDAVQQLGYMPNHLAKGLLKRRTDTIGLVIPDISNPFYPEVARGVEDVASAGDRAVVLCNTDYDVTRTQESLRVLLKRRVDGLIVAFGTSAFTDGWGIVDQLDTKVVVVGRQEGLPYPSVSVDNVANGHEAGSFLLDLGHTEIGFLAGPLRSLGVRDRLAGFQQAMKDHSVVWDRDRLLAEAPETGERAGYTLAQQLLRRPQRPTCVLAFNDRMAIGAIAAIHDAGLDVPGDVSVMGCDDIEPASYARPELTTISRQAYQIGAAAMTMLGNLLDQDDYQAEDLVLPTRLVVRASTAPLQVS